MRTGFASVLAAMMLTALGLVVAADAAYAQGLFARAQDFPAETQPESLSTADFDGDDVVVLAVTNFDSNQNLNVSILLGNGDGTFQDPANYELPPDQFQTPTAITASDLNGDGVANLATTSQGTDDQGPSNASVLLGNGDGTFRDLRGRP
jgi:hypothetical protein